MVQRKKKIKNSPSAGADNLPLVDIRIILRLATELHGLPPLGTCRRERMTTALCQLTSSNTCESAFFSQRLEAPAPIHLSSVAMGSTGRRVKSILNSRYIDPAMLMLLKRLRTRRSDRPSTDTTLTQTRAELLTATSDAADPLQTDGIKDAIYSVRRLATEPRHDTFSVLCVAWYATNPSSPTARDCRIVDLLHAETPWIGECLAILPERLTPFPAGLTSRQMECLQMLLTGQSEKQIASKLRLSPHTVHIYVKGLYRAYGVATRGELMACFVPVGGRSPG